MIKRVISVLAVFALLSPLAVVQAKKKAKKKAKWEKLIHKRGIVVHRRIIEGSPLVEFRGRGTVNGSLLEILAILADTDKYPQWVERNIGTRIIAKKSETEMIYYSSTKAPWPFQNRDFVARFRFVADEKNGWIHLLARNTKHPKAPKKSGMTRMPFIKVRWSLKPMKPRKTWMEFRVHADPGGNIPDWVNNLVSKNIPYKSIVNLRKRIKQGKASKKFMNQYKQWDGWGLKKKSKK